MIKKNKLKNKTLLYFGIVLLATIISSFILPLTLGYLSFVIPIIYTIFFSLNLYKKSIDFSKFSYLNGLSACFSFGTYCTLIYIFFNATFVFLIIPDLYKDSDIYIEGLVMQMYMNGETALVNGIIYTTLLSLVIPIFFIKNKNPDKNIILDDDKF